MSEAIEVVRFTVRPARAQALVEGHERARLAIDAVAPGWIWSRLARLDEHGWVEIVAWSSRAAFQQALELSVRQPVALAWFELADEDWTLELGEHLDGDGSPPPRAGTLELTSSASADDADLVAAPRQESVWSALIKLDGRVWSRGEWRTSGPGLLRIGVQDRSLAEATPPWVEAAEIVHAYDAAGELSRPA